MASHESETFHWHYAEFDDNAFQIRGRTLFFAVVLFGVILFITIIYLYARWVCQMRPPSLPRISHAPSSAQPPPRGLDPNAISNLPIILHRASEEAVECSICLGIFQDGEKVKVLPDCQHRYHSECVDVWLTTQSSCPLCRASLRDDDSLSPV
ncbi:OLC1v1026852C1 [Oldenlandia corymbosa var. corymbosa]|uniref:RING-type E3 ubiquitin transferase n=1 Tax=Oldenlandia corymbosa var. corymbosa TaxID=529605 RepID=A0AAV1C8R6_OLDCO|nr:OLC1v1026852C1 [Oldenlandia corymbosa var. corymbosa]